MAVRRVASGEEIPVGETAGPREIAKRGEITGPGKITGPIGMGLPVETDWPQAMEWPEAMEWPAEAEKTPEAEMTLGPVRPPGPVWPSAETPETDCDAGCLVEERPGRMAWPVLPAWPEFCWPWAKQKKEKGVPWPSYHPVPTRPVFSPRPILSPHAGLPVQPPDK